MVRMPGFGGRSFQGTCVDHSTLVLVIAIDERGPMRIVDVKICRCRLLPASCDSTASIARTNTLLSGLVLVHQ